MVYALRVRPHGGQGRGTGGRQLGRLEEVRLIQVTRFDSNVSHNDSGALSIVDSLCHLKIEES